VSTYFAPRADVRIAGVLLAADVADRVISLSYDSNADMADMFTVTLLNGDGALTDSALFDIGKEVEIHLGYGANLQPMMLGEIASLQPSFPEGGAPTLTITGYDRSFRLRHGEPLQDLWREATDSMIAAAIAAAAGLVPVVDPSPLFHEELPQTTNDMAFLRERARANFFEVFVEWDRLHFQLPRLQTEAYVLEWGRNLSSFSPRLARSAGEGIEIVRGWDEELAQAVVGFATSADLDLQNITERLGQAGLDTLLALGRQAIRSRRATTTPEQTPQEVDSPDSAFDVAKALLGEIFDGLYEGSGSCIGIPELRAGTMIRIAGIGKRFSGVYRLKRVTHTLADSGYRTAFEATQRSGTSLLPLLRKTLTELPPPDRRPPAHGLVTGTVLKNVDPKGRGRVKVSYPDVSDDSESAWARVATPMAGSDRGMWFLPDVGDEVLVAFRQGKSEKPIVLGSLWNGTARPPADNADGANAVRMIKTKVGHSIELHEPPANKVVVHHATGGEIVIDKDGKVTVKGTNTVEVTATTVNVNGTVNVKGSVSIT
jgi:phage protein D/phage baseplate assembly protein gpV